MPRRCLDCIDWQPQLWNVAITQARSNLIVVETGSCGGVGAELAAASETAPDEHGLDQAFHTRLYNHLRPDDPAVCYGSRRCLRGPLLSFAAQRGLLILTQLGL